MGNEAMILTAWTWQLANHLWQSTAFGAAAWVLTFLLRKNRAQTRYWVWLCASLKFLLPFSLLVALGRALAPAHRVAAAPGEISAVVRQATVPFSDDSVSFIGLRSSHLTPHNFLPLALMAVWALGFIGVACSAILKWWRVRATVKAGSPSSLQAPVPVKTSRTPLEPGIFGVFRPVLMLPAGIAERLTAEQMDAILAHEMCHVRRRDNLTAAMHMLVESVFWFHPMVWWIGGRLVDEREHACDEEVMQLGRDPETYAEGILSVCKFYVESPVACVSGISGADLKQRIVRIMANHLAHRLTLGSKVLLTAVAAAAIVGPLALGVVAGPRLVTAARVRLVYLRDMSDPQAVPVDPGNGPLPSFEAAAIKLGDPNAKGHGFRRNGPAHFQIIAMTARGMVEFAYGVKPFQVAGGPSWIDATSYDVDAKIDDSLAASMKTMTREQQNAQIRLMVLSLLRDRFKLSVTHSTKEAPEYALVADKGGPKLTPTKWVDPDPDAPKPATPPIDGPHLLLSNGKISAVDQPISGLANILGVMPEMEGKLVVDQSGLQGKYDFELQFTPQQLISKDGAPPSAPADDSGPSIFTALEEQLGLKLETTKGPMDVYNIDHVEQPTEN
jgi:bla regulator protein blaR1